jgi:hypothetical protein
MPGTALLGWGLALALAGCGGGGTTPSPVVVVQAAPTFTTPPAGQSVLRGQQALFTAVVAGNPAPTLQWIKNGTAIAGATAATYQTPATTTSDQNAMFVLTAVNAKGTVSSPAVPLTVSWAPAVTGQPAAQSVTVGQTATFAVGVDGFPSPSIQWQRGGQNIAGATSATYTTPVLTLADSGTTFLAVLTNTVGGTTSLPAGLTVNPAPVPVTILAQPQSQQALTGQSTAFSVTAQGTAPIHYQWQLNAVPIPGATAAMYAIPSVTHADAGAYTVIVDNAANLPLLSGVATLTVADAPAAPSIVAQPQDVTVTEGNPATFQVTASGATPLAYQWQRAQADIPGATAASYTLPSAALADSGVQFRCHVTNAVGGIDSSPSTLTVQPSPNPPVIVAFTATPDPVVLGQPVTLAWGATAARSLSIDNGVGDVSGLTTKVVTPAQLGPITWTLTATNAAGSVTAPASVTVNAVPSFPLTVTLPQGVTGQPSAGQHTYLQGTAVNYAYAPGPGYQNIQVTIDGANVNPSGTFVMNSGHTLAATAQTRILTVTPSAGAGGTVTPATPVSVSYGQGCTFTFTPNAGFLVANVLVDGVSLGASGQYDFINVTTDHQIQVTFVQSFPLTVHMGPGVTGTPGATTVLPAGAAPYSYSVLPGYTGLTVVEDGLTSLPASGTVLMDGPHSLAVNASVILLPINYIMSAGGTILPAAPGGVLNVPYGQMPTFTFVPDAGYGLLQLWVDGVQVALPAGSTYVFPAPITAAHAIQAIFAPLP